MYLDHLLDWTATFETPLDVGTGPLGQRIVANITGGSFEGPKLRGTVLRGGADWALIQPDGNLRLDVRVLFRTDDDALIYVTYDARMVMNDKLSEVLFEQKGETEFGQSDWISLVQFETGDERYGWLNNTMAAGEGLLGPNRVSYRVFRLGAGDG